MSGETCSSRGCRWYPTSFGCCSAAGVGLFSSGAAAGFSHGCRSVALGRRRLGPTRCRGLGSYRGTLEGSDGRHAKSRNHDSKVLGQDDLQISNVEGLGPSVLGQPNGLFGHLVQEIVRELQYLLFGVGLDAVIGIDRFDQIRNARADKGCNMGSCSRLGGGLLGNVSTGCTTTRGGSQRETSLGSGGFRRLRVLAIPRATRFRRFGSPSIGSDRSRFTDSSLNGLLSALFGCHG